MRNSLLIAILWLSTLAQAGQVSRLGGWEGALLRMGGGASALAMGNAVIADSAVQPSAFWNPAMLPLARPLTVSASAERRALDRVGGTIGVSKAVAGRMGVGMAFLWRGDSDFRVIDEEDRELGSSQPSMGFADVGVGWRLSRQSSVGASLGYLYEDWDVARHFPDVDPVDAHTSAAALTVGWTKQSSKFSWAVVSRNMGFGRNASVAWTRTSSRSNQLSPSRGIIPKSLEASSQYRTTLWGRPFRQQVALLDYQLADTLAVFDPELHVWQARYGAQWDAFQDGAVRLGYDAGTFTAGAGYLFRVRMGARRWPLQVDYAFLFERAAGFSPFALGSHVRF